MKRRPFDKESYDRNDKKAKDTLRKYLDGKGVYSLIPKENYGADLYSNHPHMPGITMKHEVEMKNMWDKPWPDCWRTIHIPERKARLLEDGEPIVFWIIRADCSEAWYVRGDLLTEDILEEVPNRCIKEGERFFCIPIEKCKLIRLNG